MVGVFSRSFSVPNKHCSSSSTSKPPISHHNRSISLPCRSSHPLISHLKGDISHLIKNWSTKSSCRTSAWLCDGLKHLKNMHDTLVYLIHLPQTQELIRTRPQWLDNVLDDLLCLVDVYGMFQTYVMAFKEQHFDAKVAIRKRDESRIALYLKARKNMAKEMSKLVDNINVTRCSSELVSSEDVELVGVIGDVLEVTVMVSVAVFNGIATSFGSSRKMSMMGFKLLGGKGKRDRVDESVVEIENFEKGLSCLRKKGDEEVRMALNRMRDLEECICGIESECEKMFRGLINTRVTLLNSLTL